MKLSADFSKALDAYIGEHADVQVTTRKHIQYRYNKQKSTGAYVSYRKEPKKPSSISLFFGIMADKPDLMTSNQQDIYNVLEKLFAGNIGVFFEKYRSFIKRSVGAKTKGEVACHEKFVVGATYVGMDWIDIGLFVITLSDYDMDISLTQRIFKKILKTIVPTV